MFVWKLVLVLESSFLPLPLLPFGSPRLFDYMSSTCHANLSSQFVSRPDKSTDLLPGTISNAMQLFHVGLQAHQEEHWRFKEQSSFKPLFSRRSQNVLRSYVACCKLSFKTRLALTRKTAKLINDPPP